MRTARKRPGKIPYGAIKVEYVTGEQGIRELAKKYHVSVSGVFARARKEGWIKARMAFDRETQEFALAEAFTDRVRGLLALRKRVYATGLIALNALEKRLKSKGASRLPPRELAAAQRALALALETGAKAMGAEGETRAELRITYVSKATHQALQTPDADPEPVPEVEAEEDDA